MLPISNIRPSPRTMRVNRFLLLVVLTGSTLSCRRFVGMDDPSLEPFRSMHAVDRSQYGMTALPSQARVRIDKTDSSYVQSHGYAMIHIYGKSVHHIVFRLENGSYRWVGEQEQCWGPQRFDTVDGRFNEMVVVSYFQNIPDHLNGLHATYSGPGNPTETEISISRAKQLLKEWGCS